MPTPPPSVNKDADIFDENQNNQIEQKAPEKFQQPQVPFGVRPSEFNQVKPKATGANLVQFEKFLVQLTMTTIPPIAPGLPSTSKLVGGKVSDKTGSSKLEPHLVYGSRAKDVKGFNQQFIPDARTPIQLWFPKGAVQENDKLKAGEATVLIKDRAGLHYERFFFFEYKGGKTIDQQIADCKAEYEYVAE